MDGAAGLEADSPPVAGGETGKRKTRKVRRISQAAPKPEKMAVAEVPQIATEQGRADSAPTPAPKPEKLTTRQIRRTWGGKYADLTPQSHTPTGGQGAGQ
jgi:hypothetical protein